MKSKGLVRLLVGALIGVAIMIIVLIRSNFIHNPEKHAPMIDEPVSSIAVTVKDYKVYNLKDIPFRFILADIVLVNNKPIEFELSRFLTSEQVQLDRVDSYKSEILAKGYDLSKQNVTNILTSNENSISATIFIPIKNNHLNEIKLNIAGVKPSQLTFRLNTNLGISSDLGKEISLLPSSKGNHETVQEPEQKPVGPDQTVSNRLIINPAIEIEPSLISFIDKSKKTHLVQFKEGTRAFLVKVDADFNKEVTINAARLNFENTQELVFALGSEYTIEGYTNLLQRPIAQGSGYLLFTIDSTTIDPLNQPYKIEARTNYQSSWIELLIK